MKWKHNRPQLPNINAIPVVCEYLTHTQWPEIYAGDPDTDDIIKQAPGEADSYSCFHSV